MTLGLFCLWAHAICKKLTIISTTSIGKTLKQWYINTLIFNDMVWIDFQVHSSIVLKQCVANTLILASPIFTVSNTNHIYQFSQPYHKFCLNQFYSKGDGLWILSNGFKLTILFKSLNPFEKIVYMQ
jgi:hypothetical protein